MRPVDAVALDSEVGADAAGGHDVGCGECRRKVTAGGEKARRAQAWLHVRRQVTTADVVGSKIEQRGTLVGGKGPQLAEVDRPVHGEELAVLDRLQLCSPWSGGKVGVDP